ncbi:phosphoribosylformylglycinamidine synthase [Sphingobacterium daejeonense]|nr:hypothetical protein [Sphingobacterium daejeonense]VTQ02817.1 phosphoribosylformylglycinamidine synthase [Sphingobacterium daejeonense]
MFNENIGLVLQAKNDSIFEKSIEDAGIEAFKIGKAVNGQTITIKNNDDSFSFNVEQTRDTWFKTSFLLDQKQSKNGTAEERFKNYKNQPVAF